MAKYSVRKRGDFGQFISHIRNEIANGSVSASLEEFHEMRMDRVRCAVMVFERYSFMGKNRLSLNITVIEENNNLGIIAATSGGSQAIFFKINTIGEDAFLKKAIEAIDSFSWQK